MWYNVIIENSNKEVAKMTHKQEVKLNRLQWKLNIESEIVETLLNERGKWQDGTGKEKIVLMLFEGERLEYTVYKGEGTYYITPTGWKAKMKITDKDLIEILDDGVKKVAGNKAKKAKAQKKVKKAEKKSVL